MQQMNRNRRDRKMRNREQIAADWAARAPLVTVDDPSGQRWEDLRTSLTNW